jgi:protein SCO1/2
MFFKSRYPVIALSAALALVVIAALISFGGTRSGQPVTSSGVGPVLADFQLIDQKGAVFRKANVLGKPSAFFFGFTNCPDVCPTMLSSITAHLGKLGADGDRINFVFVSVDPARDTPEVIDAYLTEFDPRIRGISGQKPQLDKLTKSLGIYYAKVDTGGASYSVDHSALIVLLDSRGQFFGTIAYDEGADVALMKLQRLADEGYR